MKSANCQLLRRRFILGLVLLLVPVTANPASAQASPSSHAQVEYGDGENEDTPSAYLTLETDDDGAAKVTFYFDSSLEQKYNFRKVVSTVLGCPLEDLSLLRDDERGSTFLHARCDLPLRRTVLAHKGTIDLQPIRDIQNVEPNVAFIFSISVPQHDFVRCNPVPEQFPQDPLVATCLYFSKDSAHQSATLRFEFGYSRAHTVRLSGILAFFLLLPIALTFWFRRRALTAPDQAKPTVWFAYRRFLTWTGLLGTLVWWAALDLLHADEFVKFLLPSWNWSDSFASTIIPWILLWTPPVIVYFLCLALSSPMQTLRDTKPTQRQILNQSFWAVARFVLPLSFICLGVTEMFDSPRLGVLFVAAGIVAGKFTNSKFVRAYGLELNALTSGELRDRAFAMAHKANTKLNQLYVLPAERLRMANAFAHIAHNVFLTDYLLKNLSKTEVDAVVGHEIAHLQNKHIGRRMTVVFIVVVAFAFSAAFLEYWLPRGLPNGPIFYTILLLALFFMSRRNEFAADAGSVKLTGDAEAMITALSKLTRLNTMPLQWSKLDEKLLTHPSTLRRIRRIAGDAGISDARVSELLSQSGIAPTETYSIPPTALPAGKLFSTRYKSRIAGKYAWAVILTTVVLPAIVAIIARWGGFRGEALWFAYLLGFLLTLAADLALLNFLPMLQFPKLERQLREKCRVESTVSGTCSDLFVSLAPDSGPRIYEGNWAWDLGFLSLTQERLTYLGEEARFALRREEISSVTIGPGPVGWFRTPSVYVSWCDSLGREGIFNLRPLQARSMRDMAVKTRVLARDLENWHRRVTSSSNPILILTEQAGERLDAPTFGEVTGMSPKILVRGRSLARDFFLNTFVAAGVILLFGLGFPLFADEVRPLNSVEMNPALSGFYVLAVVWITRAFVLAPYLLAHEKKSLTETVSSAVTQKASSTSI